MRGEGKRSRRPGMTWCTSPLIMLGETGSVAPPAAPVSSWLLLLRMKKNCAVCYKLMFAPGIVDVLLDVDSVELGQ